jgi:multidrug efflux pump subunit AcrA (membrane-fusion protein)
MTANMTIVTEDKKQVLVVPTRAILDGASGKIVRVVTDEKKGTYSETTVTIGTQGDDGTEVLSGVSQGQQIVILSGVAATK